MQDDRAVLYPTKSDGRIWLKYIKTRPDRVPAGMKIMIHNRRMHPRESLGAFSFSCVPCSGRR